MTANGWLQILFYSVVLLALTKPMGLYVLNVYDGSFRGLARRRARDLSHLRSRCR